MADILSKKKALEQGICPICGQIMQYGYIPASKFALQWFPEGSKLPPTIYQTGKDAVVLSKVPFLKCQKVPSFYCKSCDVVITPVDKSIN